MPSSALHLQAPLLGENTVQLVLPELRMLRPGQSGRAQVEQFIAAVFEQAWGARITGFLPWLCSLHQPDTDMPQAALGLRPAAGETLFCEQYLDEPLLSLPRRLHRQECQREDIMELGNLAAVCGGRGALLYMLATQAAHRAGVRYLLFAANRAVRLSIRRSGFTPLVVGPADPARLGDHASDWGRYYEGDPVVMLGDLALTDRQARQRPGVPALLAHYASAIEALASLLREVRG